MIRGIVMDLGGFPPLDEQREALPEEAVVATLAPADDAAWTDAVEAICVDAGPGDVIAVAALHALGPDGPGILTALDRLRALGLELVAPADEVDTREDPGFLAAAGLLRGAAEHAEEAAARRLVALAASRPEGVSPPQAIFVPAGTLASRR